jgi:DNA-binding response OmpR family regulator
MSNRRLYRILIVDDEPDLLEVCDLALSLAGHSVQTLDGGAKVREVVERFHPDLILLDWVMTDVSGPEVLLELRGTPFGKIPVLMMTALADGSERVRRIGADGFLAKPFGVDDLERAVDALIGRRVEPVTPRPRDEPS